MNPNKYGYETPDNSDIAEAQRILADEIQQVQQVSSLGNAGMVRAINKLLQSAPKGTIGEVNLYDTNPSSVAEYLWEYGSNKPGKININQKNIAAQFPTNFKGGLMEVLMHEVQHAKERPLMKRISDLAPTLEKRSSSPYHFLSEKDSGQLPWEARVALQSMIDNRLGSLNKKD